MKLFRRLFIILLNALFAVSVQANTLEDLEWKYSQQFLNYTTWSFDGSSKQLCILGDTNIPIDNGEQLATKSGTFDVFIFEQMPTIKRITSCQAVYFASSMELIDIQFYLAEIKTMPILTIGHHISFRKLGGHIQFIVKNNKLRFFINTQNLEASQLKMHPALIRLSEKED